MIALRPVLLASMSAAALFAGQPAAAQNGHAGHAGHAGQEAMSHDAHSMEDVTPAVPVEETQSADHAMHQGHSEPAARPAEQDHSAHGQHGGRAAQSGNSTSEIGNAPPPPVPSDHAADRFFTAEQMRAARKEMAHMGRHRMTVISIDQLEYRAASGGDGYGWAGEIWTGHEISRLVLATEGEGSFGNAPERAEFQAKWRRALDPWFNLEMGLRQDVRPVPQRTYAMVGIAGDAPFWIEVAGHLFLSSKGDVHARLEVEHDWRLTSRFVLQGDIELNAALQDVAELGIAAGFERIEGGARLRYELSPDFAPYVGLHWERKLGGTASIARLNGDHVSQLAAVFGIRTWF